MTRDAITLAALLAALPATSLGQPRPSGDVAPPPAMGDRLYMGPHRDPPPTAEPPRRDVPPPPEWARERQERREDARASRDDFRDLVRAERLLAEYDRAVRARDGRELSRLEGDALELIRMEWLEGRGELAQDRREARDDRRDLGREMREGDRGGAAGERRELREDRREARLEARTLERLRRMGEELYALRDRFRPREVSRKRAIIADFVKLARRELKWDRRERMEDRRDERHDRMDDRHEDRHDRMDDRR